MSIKRIVDTGFWTDEKVSEDFSPEDRYFMLYILTNPHTTQLGIYTFIPKIAAFELGYSVDVVNVLLDRFDTKYNIIKFNKATKEIAVKNYLVYSIVKGGKPVEDLLKKEILQVKCKKLLSYVFSNLYNKGNLNETVKNIVNRFINDNDDDNDESYHDSYHDSSNGIKRQKKSKIPTYDEVLEYAKQRGREDLAQKFYDYYTAMEWTDKDGKKVLRWKGKFITWENNNPQSKQNKDLNKGKDYSIYDE